MVPAALSDPPFAAASGGAGVRSRAATSVDGVLIGRGGDIFVIDVPLKPQEALSQAQRQAASEWYDHTLYSRLNDKLTGAIVLFMHRLHESLTSGLTRGTTSPATCWRTSRGRCSAFLSNLYQTPFKKRNNRMCL